MEFKIDGAKKPYRLRAPQGIETPRLLVFQDRVEYNINRMAALLRDIQPQLGLNRVWPHVKTTKSSWAVTQLQAHGISRFKTTMNEVDMLVECRAEHIFVAYPLLAHDARKIAQLTLDNPQCAFYIQIGSAEHLEIIQKSVREFPIQWHYFIDVNVGMGRTGLAPDKALALYRHIEQDSRFIFEGLHAYDGHVHQVAVDERRRTAEQSMVQLRNCIKQFDKNGVKVPQTIVAGTPGFLIDAEILLNEPIDSTVYFSPGTWVYFDSQCHEMMPETFDFAALILAQVIDRATPDTATLNLGHKRWAVDQGPIELFSASGLKVLSYSEEHTVVSVPNNVSLNIGDYLLIVPRHVCPTVNLWEHFIVVNEAGDVEEAAVPVDARNR